MKKSGISKRKVTNRFGIKAIKKYHNYYLMLLPGLVFVIMFLYLPIFYNFIAFKNYKIFMGPLEAPGMVLIILSNCLIHLILSEY